MKKQDRKAVLSAYKERKVTAGIFAIRCQVTNECWIGGAPDLSTIQNRIWFTMRMGTHPCPSLRQAQRDHGMAAFTFDVVESIDLSKASYDASSRLREKARDWAHKLNATLL